MRRERSCRPETEHRASETAERVRRSAGLGLKRAVDVAGAGLGLVVGTLPMLIVAILVRARLGAPVLFVQPRVGRGGAEFQLYKFRTLRDTVDEHGRPLPDAHRMTELGAFLRSMSLDELPELWNVLRGDMSLVGPRPLLPEYLDRYTPTQARRHEVRPGLTGLAQIAGRNAVGWHRRFELDVWYVDNRSFWLDCRIVARTVVKVLRRDGITAEGSVTAEEFLGSR